MDKALAELIRISNESGKDPRLVQGGGGNTSVKTADGQFMFIKASGTALKDMNEKRGWRRLKLDEVLGIINDPRIVRMETSARETEVVHRLLLACDDNLKTNARPSVEAHLHAYLDSHIIHLHPSTVGAYVNAKNGKNLLEKLFPNKKLPFLWVPYVDPGFTLARKIASLTADYQKKYGKKPAILFLEKHGLFISADSADNALGLVRKVINRCSAHLRKVKRSKTVKMKIPDLNAVNQAKLNLRHGVFAATGQHLPVSHFYNPAVASFLAEKSAPRLLATTSLTPDELVYANGSPVWLDSSNPKLIADKITSLLKKGMKPPLAFLLKGVGLFIAGEEKITPAAREIAESSFFIRSHATRLGGIKSLTSREEDFINKWESEAFRKQQLSSTGKGQLQNRMAVVTGSGSGLGRSIALGLARAGALVAVADIDASAARQTVDLIKSELPAASTMALTCNVTDENSVSSAFTSLLDRWGGLDILVNAAGIAPAGPLVELPVQKLRQTLEINLTGYFLMAQAAARIMIAQNIGGSIINISSKSGLEASKNNTPYNATKAGELHMARGWAMELGQYGIRVNCVCPGNVFEGSKIWNPSYLRICAKKYGIKPEQVIPYYVDKTILKREIKGQDIADSVVFLCSDQARMITGQIIVADAGQVLVR